MGKITVPALPTEKEMWELIQSHINDEESDFSNVLDHDVSHIDQRAQAHDVQVTEVNIEGSQIEVVYDVEYSIYNGCKDMDVQDAVERRVFGEKTAGGWTFNEHVPPPKRSTMDEF